MGKSSKTIDIVSTKSLFLFRFGWGGAITHRGLPGCSPRLDEDLASRILNSGTRRSASGPGHFTPQGKEEEAKPSSGTVRKNASSPKRIELKYFGRPGYSRDTIPTELSQQSLNGYGKYETKRRHRKYIGRWEDNIKTCRKEKVCNPMDRISVAQDRV
jgi:hypothetical protein